MTTNDKRMIDMVRPPHKRVSILKDSLEEALVGLAGSKTSVQLSVVEQVMQETSSSPSSAELSAVVVEVEVDRIRSLQVAVDNELREETILNRL